MDHKLRVCTGYSYIPRPSIGPGACRSSVINGKMHTWDTQLWGMMADCGLLSHFLSKRELALFYAVLVPYSFVLCPSGHFIWHSASLWGPKHVWSSTLDIVLPVWFPVTVDSRVQPECALAVNSHTLFSNTYMHHLYEKQSFGTLRIEMVEITHGESEQTFAKSILPWLDCGHV